MDHQNDPQKKGGVRSALGAIHGAGEAIRGGINVFADRATGDHREGSKNQQVMESGVARMNNGRGTAPTVQQAGTTAPVNSTDSPYSTNYGPHNSNLANKMDPRVDSDLNGRGAAASGATASSATHGNSAYSTNYGPHDSNLANKMDPRVDSNLGGRGAATSGASHGNSAYSTNYGPHDSNLANKMDPRVDSDLDGRGAATSGAAHGNSAYSTNYGPHDSNLANKMDPRVDSDMDNRGAQYGAHNPGHNVHHNHHHHHGHHPHATTTNPQVIGTTGASYTNESPYSTNHGPHDSNLANKADPRVDSDMDNRDKPVTGPHKSALLNKLDPRVDSKRGGVPSGTQMSGNQSVQENSPYSTNYGPHDSNLANKADPRVDSNMSGGLPQASGANNGAPYGQSKFTSEAQQY